MKWLGVVMGIRDFFRNGVLVAAGLAALVGGGCENQNDITGELIGPPGVGVETEVESREGVSVVEANEVVVVSPSGVSGGCVELIKRLEGFRSSPYFDNGQMAIGYGHCILPGEEFADVNESQATELLYGDLTWAEKVVSGNVDVALTQNQYDALCSFVYNVGSGNFEKSTLLRKLNQRDYVGAANEFIRWDGKGDLVVDGLVRRRSEEVALFRR